MHIGTKYISFIALALVVLVATGAWSDQRSVVHGTDGRVNRELLSVAYHDVGLYALVDSMSNVIADRDSVLMPLMEKLLALRSGGDSVVSILHIGDSHIQAGYLTSRVRELFQGDFGNAGRGLIVPYKLAGGNEPRNYAVKTSHKYLSERAVSRANGIQAGMTGVSVTFIGAEPEFEIWSKDPFSAVSVFHHAKAPQIYADSALEVGSYCISDNTMTSTRLVFQHPVDTVRLKGRISMEYDDPTFYGFSLENGQPGVVYHAVGANSAAFEHISNNTTIADGGLAPLCPDLIVLSLGTNNCYGRNYRAEYFRSVAERFIGRLKASYPNSAILITTPMESCQRASVKGRRTYVPNPNIKSVAEMLTSVAEDNGVACWNLYAAAGGPNIHETWSKHGLMSRDKIHLTESGYVLQGDMLYEAFTRYYNNLWR